MEMIILNPQKGRLEKIDVVIHEANTTWFEDCLEPDDIYMITDTDKGVLIRENNYSYPVLVYNVTRSDIGDKQQKAKIIRDSILFDLGAGPQAPGI